MLAQRKESRGLHYIVDYPSPVKERCYDSVIAERLKERYDLARFATAGGSVPSVLITATPASNSSVAASSSAFGAAPASSAAVRRGEALVARSVAEGA